MSIPLLRAVVFAAALQPYMLEAAPLSLESALQLAVKRSDAARAARAGIQSATEASRAAGRLPDPVLRVGVENLPVTGPDRFSTTRDPMTMKRIGISQEWLPSEKRAARERFRAGVVIPAEQRTAAATAAYRSNQASLLTVFEARHAEVEVQRKLVTLQRELAKTQVRLAFRSLSSDGAP